MWREGRIARKTGKQYPPGWYGIEVMDVEEVDAVIKNLLPELDPKEVGSQDWTVSLATVLQTSPEAVRQYVILKNCRYRLNEAALAPVTCKRVQQVRQSPSPKAHAELDVLCSVNTARPNTSEFSEFLSENSTLKAHTVVNVSSVCLYSLDCNC